MRRLRRVTVPLCGAHLGGLHSAKSGGPEFQICAFTCHCATSRWLRVYAGMNRPLPLIGSSAVRVAGSSVVIRSMKKFFFRPYAGAA